MADLPVRPDLGLLHHQAKDLLRARPVLQYRIGGYAQSWLLQKRLSQYARFGRIRRPVVPITLSDCGWVRGACVITGRCDAGLLLLMWLAVDVPAVGALAAFMGACVRGWPA